MATIKQVADAAGVSFKTVSRVVNDDRNVSADTRARVLDAIHVLGYRPNLVARNMRTRRTHLLGLVADEIATTPFAVNLIKGAQDAAWKRGFMLMIVNGDNDAQRTQDAIETLLERKVEGMIYATMRHEVIEPPQNLHEALTALEQDTVIRSALGPVADEFLRLKHMEWVEYMRHVSDWEVDYYLEFF